MNVVAKLHRKLGHPGRDRLLRAIKDAKMSDEVIQCAKEYQCDVCAMNQPHKLEKPVSLPQTSHFNQMLEADVCQIKWESGKAKVLAIIDIYSRYEINAVLKRETEEEELKVLEQAWIQHFGAPQFFRTDSSGAHISQKYLEFFDKYNIKLILVPKEAHHRMGTVERLHAVRRLQLLKMKKEEPDLSLDVAVRVACQQRNRLRSVAGSSPV